MDISPDSQEDWSHLSIVVPAYDEPGIASTISALVSAVPGAEIIVVDDGSEEPVQDVLSACENVRVRRHERNLGYGAALKTGMRASTRPIICWYDGDGQHAPEDLKAVVETLDPMKESNVDVCIGVRQRGSDRSISRLPGKFFLEATARLLAGSRIPDLNSGLRAFRREVIERYLHLLPDGFSASSTSTLILLKRGYRLAHVPIKTVPRTGDSTVRMLRDGFSTFRLILNIILLFDAFKVFGTLSLTQLGLGLVYGVFMFFRSGRTGFSVFAALLILSGIFTFFVALIADQISAIRKERFESLER